MSVTVDVATEFATFTTTSPATQSHAGGSSPKGVGIVIAHGTDNTDRITSCSYGGVSLARKDTVNDPTGEPGRVYVYFRGDSIPSGTQDASIVHDGGATVKWACVFTVDANGDVEIGGFLRIGADVANPQLALDSGTIEALRFMIIYSGLAAPTDLTPVANMTAIHDHDFGAFVARFDRQTTAGTGSFTIGYTSASDDVATCAFMIQEVQSIPANSIIFLTNTPTNPNASEDDLITLLTNAGYTVTLYHGGSDPQIITNVRGVVVGGSIADELGTISNGTGRYRDYARPIFISRGGPAGLALALGTTATESTTIADIIFPQHPLADGNALGNVTILSSAQTLATMTVPCPGGIPIAEAGAVTEILIMGVEVGGMLTGSVRAENRRVFFGLPLTTGSVLTADGNALFLKQIEWMLDGVPYHADITGSPTVTSFPTTLPSRANDFYLGWRLAITENLLNGYVFECIASVGSTWTVKVTRFNNNHLVPLPGAPSSGDAFIVCPANNYTVGATARDFTNLLSPSTAFGGSIGARDLVNVNVHVRFVQHADAVFDHAAVLFLIADWTSDASHGACVTITSAAGQRLTEKDWSILASQDWQDFAIPQMIASTNYAAGSDLIIMALEGGVVSHLYCRYDGQPTITVGEVSSLIKINGKWAAAEYCLADGDGLNGGAISERMRGVSAPGGGANTWIENCAARKVFGAAGSPSPSAIGINNGAPGSGDSVHGARGCTAFGCHFNFTNAGTFGTQELKWENCVGFDATVLDFNPSGTALQTANNCADSDNSLQDALITDTNCIFNITPSDWFEANFANGDIRLKATSPGLLAGKDLGFIPSRISGNGVDRNAATGWDIGIYQGSPLGGGGGGLLLWYLLSSDR